MNIMIGVNKSDTSKYTQLFKHKNYDLGTAEIEELSFNRINEYCNMQETLCFICINYLRDIFKVIHISQNLKGTNVLYIINSKNLFIKLFSLFVNGAVVCCSNNTMDTTEKIADLILNNRVIKFCYEDLLRMCRFGSIKSCICVNGQGRVYEQKKLGKCCLCYVSGEVELENVSNLMSTIPVRDDMQFNVDYRKGEKVEVFTLWRI